MRKKLERFGEVGLLMTGMALDCSSSIRQRVDFRAPSKPSKQQSREGRLWNSYKVSRFIGNN